MTRAMTLAVVAGASLLSGCAGELPSPSVIDKLRLLAMTADSPEVVAGNAISMRAVWADGSSSAPTREVHFLWRLCLEGTDREPRTCLIPARGTDVLTGTAQSGADRVQLAPEQIPLAPGQDATTYFVLIAMCPVSAPVYDGSLGQYVCPSEEGVDPERREGIQGIRRVTVRAAGAVPAGGLNRNPEVARVRVGGQDVPMDGSAITVSACPRAPDGTRSCTGVPIAVHAAEGSVQTREDNTPEVLLASFFTTAGGSMDRPRAVATEASPLGTDDSLSARWFPPAQPGMARLWFVLRDGRGGDVVREVPVIVR